MVNRFDVYLINLDERLSGDPKNTRPAVIISPEEANRYMDSVIIAPLSTTTARYPTRVPIKFLNATRHVILDQIRTVDKSRLVKKIGSVDPTSHEVIIGKLTELFAR